ncbi:MAG TPA: hypothetical protein VL463_10315 [Kofleriaceae bacterium]|nr:hypothetical protein [Kofleriaceae bacterium]
MSTLALVLAIAAAVAAALPWPGMFVAMGLGIAAIGLGVVAYRRREHSGGRRLAGAAAIAVGALGFALGSTRYVLTLLAVDKLEQMLRG